jgi:ribosome-associated protein
VLAAAEAAADKKADRIVILDVSQLLVITDFFVISSGNTERQVRTIAEAVEEQVAKRHHLRPYRREGERESRWVLLDYVDFVVHVFHVEERDYYDLERLWSDAPSFGFNELGEDTRHEPATAEAP